MPALAPKRLALVAVVYVSFKYFHVTFASLVVSGLLFMKVIDNVSKLQKLRQQFAQSEGAYDRVTQLIGLTETNHEPPFGTAMPDTAGDFRFEILVVVAQEVGRAFQRELRLYARKHDRRRDRFGDVVDGADAETLLAEADRRMYLDKQDQKAGLSNKTVDMFASSSL